jgi:hypothetical protein
MTPNVKRLLAARSLVGACLAALLLAACGGGGGGAASPAGGSGSSSGSGTSGTSSGSSSGGSSSSGSSSGGNDAYSVSGVVTGLLYGNTVWLLDNGTNNTSVTANGNFTFSTPVASGTAYVVTVLTQPNGQNCTVSNGSGTIAAADVSNVSVSCQGDLYNIGVTVTGLLPTQTMIVQDNGGNDLTVSANGLTYFTAPIADTSAYAVTIATQPAGESCTVANGQGTVSAANVNVSIACTPIPYSIGGTLAGLLAGDSVVLQDNGGDNATVLADGSFVFATQVPSGSAYAVTVLTQPTGQSCTVGNGNGTVAAAAVANITVNCQDNDYNVSATVSGLLANLSLVLQDNGGDNLAITRNGSANFNTPLVYQSSYAVTVLTQPYGETCTVANSAGTVGAGNVSLSVACTLNAGSGAGSGGASLIPVPTASGNTVPIEFDGGANPSVIEFNRPFVSVVVCTPGTSGATAACQTINHVVLDTGSYGLVLRSSAISASLNLPIVTDANAQPIGACNQYGGGYSWGSVRVADLYMGGERAQSFLIADDGAAPGGANTPPSSCTSGGSYLFASNSSENGIMGVGVLLDNWPLEYTCTAGACNAIATTSYPIANLPAHFQSDNDGLLVQVPAVSGAATTSETSGTLVFGIGTKTNNALNGATAYATNASGDFTTKYKGGSYPSFLDTGSSVLYFTDSTIQLCRLEAWAFCPSPSPATLSATNLSSTGSASGAVTFEIYNADTVFAAGSVYLANLGGPFSGFQGFSSSYFDWGLPFFFGRNVFVAFQGANTPGGVGPYWAY